MKRHIGPFLFCFFTLMFLLLMQFLILHIDKLIGKDIPVGIIIELIITNLSYMVVLAAPMAVLVATLMAFGRFSELNELTALRASGVNPVKVIRPVLIASAVMCVILVWFSNNVLPEANHKARSLFIDIRLKKPGFDLKPNQFYEGLEGYIFLVNRIDGETDTLHDVTLFQEPDSEHDRAYIRAEKGILESRGEDALSLRLFNGSSLQYSAASGNVSTVIKRNSFKEYNTILDLADLSFTRSNPDKRNRSDRTMSSQAMMAVVDSLKSEINEQVVRYSSRNILISGDAAPGGESYFNKKELMSGKDSTLTPINSKYPLINRLESGGIQKSLISESIRQLREYRSAQENLQANINWRQERISQFLVEIHKKFSIPFACVVFVLFGAPVGIMTKRGNFGFAALISTVVLTFYWVSLIQGEKLADRLFISPFTGMWTFNIVLSVAGIYLILHLSTGFKLTRLFKKHD